MCDFRSASRAVVVACVLAAVALTGCGAVDRPSYEPPRAPVSERTRVERAPVPVLPGRGVVSMSDAWALLTRMGYAVGPGPRVDHDISLARYADELAEVGAVWDGSRWAVRAQDQLFLDGADLQQVEAFAGLVDTSIRVGQVGGSVVVSGNSGRLMALRDALGDGHARLCTFAVRVSRTRAVNGASAGVDGAVEIGGGVDVSADPSGFVRLEGTARGGVVYERVHTLAEPSGVAPVGSEWSFRLGGRVPRKTATVGDGGRVVESVTYDEYGFRLSFTADSVRADGAAMTRVELEDSQPVGDGFADLVTQVEALLDSEWRGVLAVPIERVSRVFGSELSTGASFAVNSAADLLVVEARCECD